MILFFACAMEMLVIVTDLNVSGLCIAAIATKQTKIDVSICFIMSFVICFKKIMFYQIILSYWI